VISIEGLTKRFGAVRALDGIDLQVEPGETLVVFGPNGAGKTTLLRIVAGVLRPTSGTVTVAGADPRFARRRIGFLGQDTYLYPQLSATENLEFYARLYGLGRTSASDALNRVEMSKKSRRPVHTLSRGETQRVAIARALLHDPDLLIADEPFSGLDEKSAGSLPGLFKRQGRTLVIATHDLERGKSIATSSITLESGRLASGG
jgi:heme ABC exporter ATP-binding subunit CcmA